MKQLFLYGFIFFLYLSSVFLLLFQLGSYPKGLYNWENYSVWRVLERQHGELKPPHNNYLSLTEGLMTDSGLSPFIGIPTEFMFANVGVNVFALRVWPAFLGVFTVLLYFFLTQKLFGLKIAAFSSTFFLFAPAFLVYMRTATNVGVSLFFSLITFYLIYLVWKHPHKITSYVLLAISLGINSYLYSPIRFFLLFAIFLLILKGSHRIKLSKEKMIYKVAFVVLVLVTGFFVFKNMPYVPETFINYYHGRGEQVFTKYSEDPTLKGQGLISIAPIIAKNATNLGHLYLNMETKPAITDYWNSKGQLINISLAPFFILGLLITFRKIKKAQYFLLLLWFLVTSLPILFTNNVHIGRLFFSLPPLFIFVGIGCSQVVGYCLKTLPHPKVQYGIFASLMVLLLFLEVSPYFSQKLSLDNYASRERLEELGMNNSDLYLFNVDNESLRFWTAYFYLHNDYAFEDLRNPDRKLMDKISPFTIHFIQTHATREDIVSACSQVTHPIIVVGSVDHSWLPIPCKNKIIQL